MTARNLKNKFTSGFTLVELLIVIGLLGAIALIVIAAINPIEQANRARDTRFRADGGQLISAIDRYFAARSEFPWMTVSAGTYGTDDAFGWADAGDANVGLCAEDAVGGGSDCTSDGVLISNDELKTEFRQRDFVSDWDTRDETIYVGKGPGASGSVYACFIPLSNSERQEAIAENRVYHLTGTGVRQQTSDCDADTATWLGGTLAEDCYVCIPE